MIELEKIKDKKQEYINAQNDFLKSFQIEPFKIDNIDSIIDYTHFSWFSADNFICIINEDEQLLIKKSKNIFKTLDKNIFFSNQSEAIKLSEDGKYIGLMMDLHFVEGIKDAFVLLAVDNFIDNYEQVDKIIETYNEHCNSIHEYLSEVENVSTFLFDNGEIKSKELNTLESLIKNQGYILDYKVFIKREERENAIFSDVRDNGKHSITDESISSQKKEESHIKRLEKYDENFNDSIKKIDDLNL